MLILGIESATAQVGCAVGGHEGVLASAHSSRARRHAESLTPSIEFVCRQARIELSELGAVAVDTGPGLFTGLRVGVATAKAVAQALRVPVIPISSLDLLAYPTRFTDRLIAAVIDARRGELFSALYRSVPGGVQRITEPRVSTPDDLRAELQAQRGDLLLVGDGAVRYRDAFRSLGRAEVVTHGLTAPVGAGPRPAGPPPGPAGGVGPAVGRHADLPAQARRRDQLGHPRRRGGAAVGTGRTIGAGLMAATTRPDPGSDAVTRTAAVVITPMRRRHLRQVLRIDQQVYPRPWSLGLYLGELSTTDGRSYLVARRGTEVVGYAGLMVIAGDAHVTTVAVAPVHQHQGLATRLLLVLAREASPSAPSG